MNTKLLSIIETAIEQVDQLETDKETMSVQVILHSLAGSLGMPPQYLEEQMQINVNFVKEKITRIEQL